MSQLQTILYNTIIFSEIICAIISIFYFKKTNKTYWRWFVIYLIFIALAELFSKFGLNYIPKLRRYYYNFFIIPVEFIFFYWLYAKKSLKSDKLFYSSLAIYFMFFILHFYSLDSIRMISSMTYTVGVFLLAIMVYLEFIKQIKSDEILNFTTNKMFYINIGVMFFYIGTLPFFALDKDMFFSDKELWSNYKTFFLFSVNIMYLLFSASFIWGKSKT
ncbi:hypothetical protein [Flavobacterium sp.]|uniref:hypothetical protein n=1 Tax=Flavobacterium sp. TaxID=239 RepID=UPI003750E208